MRAFSSPRLRRALVLTAAATAIVAGPAAAAPAQAWPKPFVTADPPACTSSMARNPVVWTVTNLETQFQRSPMTIENVHLSVPFAITDFTPQVLDNTGTAFATAEMQVPPAWVGTVWIDIRARYSGPDGEDVVNGRGEVHLTDCRLSSPPPPCAAA